MPSLLEDLTWRGLVHQMTDGEAIAQRLASGPTVAYIGFDPTSDSLHVGSLQQLVTLRRLQQAGHRPVALVGGGTGMIGDPSGKSEERQLLGPEQLEANKAGIAEQMGRFLDIGGPGGAILADNAEWLASANLLEFLRDVGKLFSVNEMVRKESVKGRLEGREQGLSFTEFSYMLLQAWDFLELYDRHGCEMQLGGSDQWGNITEGVDLIRRKRGAKAFGLTSPLVTKADGTKFGKTESGNVWLDPARTSPYAFYQFWLRSSDADAGDYLRRLTFLPRERIEELDAATAEHPERREAQRALAREITDMVHGPEETRRAEEAAAVLFTDRISGLDESALEGALGDAPTTVVAGSAVEAGMPVLEALLRSGLASSRSEARTLIKQGSVYVNGTRVAEERPLTPGDLLHRRWIVLRRGKANQHVLEVSG